METFHEANFKETLAGKIVLSVGCNTKRDSTTVVFDSKIKAKLDKLHMGKIKLADEVLILNVDGYIGESTASELAYAMALGKRVRFHDEKLGEKYLEENSHALAKQVASFAFERDHGE
jgi:nucleoside 2-deoxyribosyltransferase